MDYIELNITVSSPEQAEIITAELADFPFDSFVTEGNTLKAYIPKEQLIDCKTGVDAYLAAEGLSHNYISIETVNWNAVWESNFEPVEVEGRCFIRAPFHEPKPECGLDVVIMPKMSFGTGHHATTYLMSAAMMDHSFDGQRGLDMGSGTGVLAIIAAKLGASHVDAVDIDEWCYENGLENVETNGVADRVKPILGDVSALVGREPYDFILANINRNILLADMPSYITALRAGGVILFSGILENDIPAIVARGEELGLKLTDKRLKDGWAVLSMTL